MEANKEKRSERFWADHIRRWAASGLSRRRYCTRENLSYWTFRERLKRQSPDTGNDLVRLPREIVTRGNEITPTLEILLPGAISVRIGRGFDGELLRDVIRELGVWR